MALGTVRAPFSVWQTALVEAAGETTITATAPLCRASPRVPHGASGRPAPIIIRMVVDVPAPLRQLTP